MDGRQVNSGAVIHDVQSDMQQNVDSIVFLGYQAMEYDRKKRKKREREREKRKKGPGILTDAVSLLYYRRSRFDQDFFNTTYKQIIQVFKVCCVSLAYMFGRSRWE